MEQTFMTQHQIDEFLQKLQNDGKSRNIIGEYRSHLGQLYQTAEKNNFLLTKGVLEEWKNQQIRRGLAAGTVTNRIVKINHFLRYLGREDLCFPNGDRQNLAGMRFGNLIAIEPLPERAADRSICWKCRCISCGKEKAIPANQLKRGAQVSCGCCRASRLKETNGYIDGTCLKNVFSNKLSRNNTSGYKGVFRKRDKWAAGIQYKKKHYYLGSYDCFEDAVAARKAAEQWVKEDAEKLLEKMR